MPREKTKDIAAFESTVVLGASKRDCLKSISSYDFLRNLDKYYVLDSSKKSMNASAFSFKNCEKLVCMEAAKKNVISGF